MNKQEQLKVLQEQLVETVQSWDAIYDALSGASEDCLEGIMAGDQGQASRGLAMLYSFVLALKDLPEESSIEVIVKHMAEIMLMHGESRLGISMEVLSEEDLAKQKQLRLISDLMPMPKGLH